MILPSDIAKDVDQCAEILSADLSPVWMSTAADMLESSAKRIRELVDAERRRLDPNAFVSFGDPGFLAESLRQHRTIEDQ